MDTYPQADEAAQVRQPIRAPLRRFRAAILVALTAVTIVTFAWLGTAVVRLVDQQALTQARSYTDLIIAARAWNSQAGGVYVRKTDTVQSNPYLILLGVDPDLTLPDGSVLTLRNPAAMTREIAEQLPLAEAGSEFKLTSLEPVNPDNAPDEWERSGLVEFDRGAEEYWAVAEENDTRLFRYMRPLIVDESCLSCHGESGYEVGDVRGAISIRLPHQATAAALEETRIRLVAIAAVILAVSWLFVWLASRIFASRLTEANRRLEHAATTDALTGLRNRGYVIARLGQELDRVRRHEHSIGVALVDIDHFKHVNDAYGHAAGDEALRQVASALRSAVRTYDVVGRFGGEELLIVAPDIEPDELAVLAERIRTMVASAVIDVLAGERLTVSIGTAHVRPGDPVESTDALVARADAAMYAAKEAGRDRVVAG
ncbi:MAG: diguanylate cyclase [Coriobacteriia bacterium]|nr:diguanylate cyclase [Coriobacteriia bacterium]